MYHSIVVTGEQPTNCRARNGDYSMALSKITGGYIHNICDTNWAPAFESIGKAVASSVKPGCTHDIEYPPSSSGLERPYFDFELHYTSADVAGNMQYARVQDCASEPAAGAGAYTVDEQKEEVTLCERACGTLAMNGKFEFRFTCMHCVEKYTEWSQCDPQSGLRNRSVVIEQNPRNRGRACVLAPGDDGGQWGQWAAWGNDAARRCGESSATEARTRFHTGSIAPFDKGSCVEETEDRPCDFGDQMCYVACPAEARDDDGGDDDFATIPLRAVSKWGSTSTTNNTGDTCATSGALIPSKCSTDGEPGAEAYFREFKLQPEEGSVQNGTAFFYFIVSDDGKAALAGEIMPRPDGKRETVIVDVEWHDKDYTRATPRVTLSEGSWEQGEDAKRWRLTMERSANAGTRFLMGNFPVENFCLTLRIPEGLNSVGLVNFLRKQGEVSAQEQVVPVDSLRTRGLRFCAVRCGPDPVDYASLDCANDIVGGSESGGAGEDDVSSNPFVGSSNPRDSSTSIKSTSAAGTSTSLRKESETSAFTVNSTMIIIIASGSGVLLLVIGGVALACFVRGKEKNKAKDFSEKGQLEVAVAMTDMNPSWNADYCDETYQYSFPQAGGTSAHQQQPYFY